MLKYPTTHRMIQTYCRQLVFSLKGGHSYLNLKKKVSLDVSSTL